MSVKNSSSVENFTSVPIYYSNDPISWEAVIKDKFGPLFGYYNDLDSKGIDFVLTNLLVNTTFILSAQDNNEVVTNFDLIASIYKFYIGNLKPENIEENASEIAKYNKEIDTLSHGKNISIIKKYGILPGVTLNIPDNKLTKDYAVIMGENTFVQSDLNSTYSKYWEDKQHNYLYSPENYGSEKSQIVTVYVFSRTKGKLLDITNSLYQITTNVTQTGGNFSLKYALNYNFANEEYAFDNSIASESYKQAASIQNILRENDLIYIKFETLQIENTQDNKKVYGKVWDMIGLIDITELSSQPKDQTVTISGRDLSKLVIEDQNIFIPYQFANSQKTVFGGLSSKLFKRLFATGEYKLQFLYSMRSIEFTMGFIYNHLTNMEILSSDAKFWLNQEYGNKLTKQFEINQSGIVTSKKNIEGIWGLVKLQIDEKIKHYRIADASISSPDGSIMNQFQKLAQEPFVELQFDTFGDIYEIIARRPPWDSKSINEATMVNIESSNSISDSFTFDRDIYTIFQIDPQGALLGGGNSLPLAYIPMIVLDKYVEIWGNKFYKATTNYIDFNTYVRKTEGNHKNPKEGFIDDLCWLLEVMAYKPFTRVGIITLMGDRRIKRGMWIYYKKTNEIFYVDAVSNSATIGNNGEIERTTTLQVSRGMVLDFTSKRTSDYKRPFVLSNQVVKESIVDSKKVPKNKNGDAIQEELTVAVSRRSLASYFNLLDLSFLRESLKRNLIDIENAYTLKKEIAKPSTNGEPSEYEQTNSIVNGGVFDFFLKGNQFNYKSEKISTVEAINSMMTKSGIITNKE